MNDVIRNRSQWPEWAKKLANKWALKARECDPFEYEPDLPFPCAGVPPPARDWGPAMGFWTKVQTNPNGKRVGRRHRLVFSPVTTRIGNDPQTEVVVGYEYELVEVER